MPLLLIAISIGVNPAPPVTTSWEFQSGDVIAFQSGDTIATNS